MSCLLVVSKPFQLTPLQFNPRGIFFSSYEKKILRHKATLLSLSVSVHLWSQVWWEAVPLRSKVIGYEVFYSMTAVEDLGQWQRKTVGLTTSIDLVNLERHAQVGRVETIH